MKNLKSKFVSKIGISLLVLVQSVSIAKMPEWSYDEGPNVNDKMGKELIDITANIPNMPEFSYKIMGKQKFRPAFGPIPWRMRLDKNKVKMLFIGQDGTHIAEAAGRPATAGFGGRAQDLAAYFGVNEGAAFINTYSFTIKGQYGIYQTPYIYTDRNGNHKVYSTNFVDNQLWLASMDLDSPITIWRNSLIDWIIRNNKSSMKLIVTFGGAARDAIATYIRSKGGEVGTRIDNLIENVQMPESKEGYAGGNNTFPVLLGKDGKDLYSKMLGREIDYKSTNDQNEVMEHLKENVLDYLNEMAFTKGGPQENGIVHPAQLGGFDLDKITIKKINTRSLKGLKTDDGEEIESDILVVELPHPSYLSRLKPSEASTRVASNLESIQSYVKAGWKIPADEGMTNSFAKGESYRYSRSDIGPEFYDFGTPENRMVSRSDASRMSKNANVIVFGTRDRVKFDMTKIKSMTNAKPSTKFSSKELFIARPRTIENRYSFDPGPGEKFAKLMKSDLNFKEIFATKPGMNFKNDGIDAYYVKNHPDVDDFGHYRGTFESPKVIVLADPAGYDDLITARALTGTRGQYLQGVMNDAGINDQYLVLKTVPYGMDLASNEDWKYVLEKTSTYRENLLKEAIKSTGAKILITDGKFASIEAQRILKDSKVQLITVDRGELSKGNEGLEQLAQNLVNLKIVSKFTAKLKMNDIPRSHLSFYARIWEGTSGDRVINAKDSYRGIAFAEVAPAWAYKQKSNLTEENEALLNKLLEKLESNHLLLPKETIPKYIRRTGVVPSFTFIEFLNNFIKFVA